MEYTCIKHFLVYQKNAATNLGVPYVRRRTALVVFAYIREVTLAFMFAKEQRRRGKHAETVNATASKLFVAINDAF